MIINIGSLLTSLLMYMYLIKKQFRIEEEHADTCVIAAKYRMKIEMCNLMNHNLLVSILRFHSRFIFTT